MVVTFYDDALFAVVLGPNGGVNLFLTGENPSASSVGTIADPGTLSRCCIMSRRGATTLVLPDDKDPRVDSPEKIRNETLVGIKQPIN